MKKIEYFAPEMEVIELRYNQMVCASGFDNNGEVVPSTDDPDIF